MLQLWDPLWDSEIPSSLLVGGTNTQIQDSEYMGAGLHKLSSGPVVCAFWSWLLYDEGQHPWPPSKLSAHCPSEEAAKTK